MSIPPARRASAPRLAVAIRSLHLYLSMGASLAIAFFALSGLVANLRGEGTGEATEIVPPTALASPEALARHLQAELALPVLPTVSDGGDILAASADLGEEQVEATVWRATACLEVRRWRALPPDLALDRVSLAGWIGQRLGGEVKTSDEADDPAAPRLDLRLESVWRTHAVTVDRAARRWGVSTSVHALGSAITDLHAGRHASRWQRVLIDAVAVVLALSVLSGTALGLVWIARSRRPLVLIATSGGAICLLLLLVCR